MELSDLDRHYSLKEQEESNAELRKKQANEYIAKFGDLITPNEIENKLIYRGRLADLPLFVTYLNSLGGSKLIKFPRISHISKKSFLASISIQ